MTGSAAALQTFTDGPDRILHSGAVAGRFYAEKWFNSPDKHAYLPHATTRSLTPEQVVFICQEDVERGDRAFIYLNGIGLIRGVASRTIGAVIYMDVIADENEKAKLSTNILWLDRKSRFSVNDKRSFPRYVPKNPESVIGIPGTSKRLPCKIANISPTGASIMSPLRPPLRSKIILGQVHGEIARHHEFGFAIHFSTVQDPGMLDDLVAAPPPPASAVTNVLHLKDAAILVDRKAGG